MANSLLRPDLVLEADTAGLGLPAGDAVTGAAHDNVAARAAQLEIEAMLFRYDDDA
jgi:hypothetical protein